MRDQRGTSEGRQDDPESVRLAWLSSYKREFKLVTTFLGEH